MMLKWPEAQQLLAQVFGRRAASSAPGHFSLMSAAGVATCISTTCGIWRQDVHESFTHEPFCSMPKPTLEVGSKLVPMPAVSGSTTSDSA